MSRLMREFREFISRGSVVDLAVGIVIGIAFTAVVNRFVADVLNAFIGAVVGKPNFDNLTLAIGHGVIRYGRFITALLNFLIIGFALFLVVKVINTLRRQQAAEQREQQQSETEILAEIRDLLASGRAAPSPRG